jgi:putative flippase GtrA
VKHRISAFVTVGAIGFVLQIGSLALMTAVAGWPYEPATAVAVQLAVLHNFAWHERWTWRDRTCAGPGILFRFLRYQLTTGLTSIASNMLCTGLLVERFGMHVIPANALTVALMSVVNFIVSDRWVFSRGAAVAVAGLIAATPASAVGAELSNETLAAWNRYVAATELRENRSLDPDTTPFPAYGDQVRVAGGTIYDWRGSTWIHGTTVGAIVSTLSRRGIPPPQEDVLESRVLSRSGDTLNVYLKLIRRTIVTVTYDTEHRVTFTCTTPQFAMSRSVSTKIIESGGTDHGFLWKLNSYWRYAQVGPNVLVEVRSVSISRDIPLLLRPVAGPIIERIAKDSMDRALSAVRDFFEVRNTSD